ncbi:MAG: GGDEF domain-containing protein [Rhodanobacter sp.]
MFIKCCLGSLLLSTVMPVAATSINTYRQRAATDSHGLIAQVRQQLDRAAADLRPARERALLWGMGTAAINSNDAAALAEATLRLDGLTGTAHDEVAAAEAGFLRARHAIANGIGDGVGEALSAANQVQGHADPELSAWARFQLCDAYTLAEKPEKAMPLCRQAVADYRGLGDLYGMGDAENDVGLALATQDKVDAAALAYRQSRHYFSEAKADVLVVMVGDNLAQMYIKQGHARAALALSQASLKQELASGRISDALGSQTDIAHALYELGHHREAYARMRAAVALARKSAINGVLIDMLRAESRMAERMGDLRQALDDDREAMQMESKLDTPALRAIEVRLEQRYAVREKELRISELEHVNKLNDLKLKAVQADAARRQAQQQRQRLVMVIIAVLVLALLVVVALLVLLLRAQSKYAAELQTQALRDALTGIENRRAFMQRADTLLGGQAVTTPPHVLVLIDFDHFKRINDSAGHAVGDRVLAVVAEYLDRAVHGAGHAARIGGEEFAVLCPHLGAEAGMRLAETLRAGVAALPLPAAVDQPCVTISIGVALFEGRQCHDLSSWMRAADQALYAAKSHGRNRVVASSAMTEA